ncbi:hypothetical protein WA1_24680 [Scytonema hofmannii PCC 7110]|uniref:Sigma-70 family RNA polymerase sigma factor n=1 Tax=Scytonema hofmannii PCC 7110 TaxID=128403 RepID=A0A139X8E7_9CYAN|nr:hypothetical protein [Scytonema hofmannii]KYC40981.1 hypothetical protein WA1_24680 [Scytonema hofmannii PCC 7110]
MDKLDEKLFKLIEDTCQQPRGSLERQKGLNEIVRLIKGKLWKDNSHHYEDALQRTWLYLCRNLCEANTGKKFDTHQTSVITWLNAYLKFELQKFYTQDREKLQRFVSEIVSDPDEILDSVAAPIDVPSMLELTREWVETDPTGELRSTHIKGHPEVNCQAIILRRLPPEMSWKEISAEFNVPLATLSSFYQRHCLPRSKKFAEEQGYL